MREGRGLNKKEMAEKLMEARRAETLGYSKRRAEGTRKGPRAKEEGGPRFRMMRWPRG